MRSKLMIAAATAIALTACDDSQPTQPQNPIVVRSQAQDQLHQLDAMNRDIGLKRAILDAGFTCKRVTGSGYVQEHNNLSMWTATCDDGRKWAIFVGPDGTAQIRRCETMADLKLPECVIRETPAPAGEQGS